MYSSSMQIVQEANYICYFYCSTNTTYYWLPALNTTKFIILKHSISYQTTITGTFWYLHHRRSTYVRSHDILKASGGELLVTSRLCLLQFTSDVVENIDEVTVYTCSCLVANLLQPMSFVLVVFLHSSGAAVLTLLVHLQHRKWERPWGPNQYQFLLNNP
jgi:hypothetical protein